VEARFQQHSTADSPLTREMTDMSQHLPQDQPAVYRIEVDGQLDEQIRSWFEDMNIAHEYAADGRPITTLVGAVADQAALHGLLSRLYSLDLLVISVTRVEKKEA
jgi:hypothetical protein